MQGEVLEAKYEAYRAVLDCPSAGWILAQPRLPVAIALRLRQILASIATSAYAPGGKYLVPHQAMEAGIVNLDVVTGGYEWLLSSPIPPMYSRHILRIIVLYLVILPVGLVAYGITTLRVIVASSLVSYILTGIDEIGMDIENSFPLFPLQQLVAATQI